MKSQQKSETPNRDHSSIVALFYILSFLFMDFKSLSPRKKAFIIIGGIAVLLLIYGMIKLSG
jgi:membrane-bound ClpP family serine protease